MTRYQPLLDHLDAIEETAVRLRIDDLDAILGAPVPPSARRYPAYWSGSLGRALSRIGWRASPHLAEQVVDFRRLSSEAGTHTADGTVHAAREGLATPDLVLVGCVKTKRAGEYRARDLYDSTLFRGRARRAEETGAPWYILSALHGLVAPDDVIGSYELALAELPVSEIRGWSERLLRQLDERVGPLSGALWSRCTQGRRELAPVC